LNLLSVKVPLFIINLTWAGYVFFVYGNT